MVGEACLPSNAYYPRTPDYTLCSGVHVCWSEHSDSSFVYGFMILNYGFGTMTATTYICVVVSSNLITSVFVYFAGFERVHRTFFYPVLFSGRESMEWPCFKRNVTDTQTLQKDLRFPFMVLSPASIDELAEVNVCFSNPYHSLS